MLSITQMLIGDINMMLLAGKLNEDTKKQLPDTLKGKLIIDLSAVTHISEEGIRALVSLSLQQNEDGEKEVAFVMPQANTQATEKIKMAGVEQKMDFYHDLDTAFSSLL